MRYLFQIKKVLIQNSSAEYISDLITSGKDKPTPKLTSIITYKKEWNEKDDEENDSNIN